MIRIDVADSKLTCLFLLILMIRKSLKIDLFKNSIDYTMNFNISNNKNQILHEKIQCIFELVLLQIF